jgi:hypothetical protein
MARYRGQMRHLRIRALSRVSTVMCVALLAGASCSFPLGPDSDIPYPTISPRPGMTGVSWSHFGFGVPSEWRPRDGTGPNYWDGADGEQRLYAEVFSGCGKAKRPDSPPPKFVTRDDTDNGGSARVRRTSRFSVPGAAGAWRYELDSAAGERRTALNAWISDCQKEVWLVISAGPEVADKIASTLVAQEKK